MKVAVHRLSLMFVVMLSLVLSVPVLAQDRGGEGGEGADRGGDRGGRQRWEEMSEEERDALRKRMEERRAEYEKQQSEEMRERLKMSAEDFEVIGPMIDKVRTAQRERDSAMRAGRGFGQRGGTSTFGVEQTEHVKASSEAMAELRQALEDDDAGDIKNALTKLRKARAALDKAVKDAQAELQGVCTAKWEAEFVMMGLLD